MPVLQRLAYRTPAEANQTGTGSSRIMIDIAFRPNFPDELKASVIEHFRNAEWLVPIWCHKVVIDWWPDKEYVCEVSVYRDYRELYLNVSSRWIDEPFETRRMIMIHEMIHCFTVPLKRAVCAAADDLGVDDKVIAMIHRQINETMEQVTQDFAIVIDRKFR